MNINLILITFLFSFWGCYLISNLFFIKKSDIRYPNVPPEPKSFFSFGHSYRYSFPKFFYICLFLLVLFVLMVNYGFQCFWISIIGGGLGLVFAFFGKRDLKSVNFYGARGAYLDPTFLLTGFSFESGSRGALLKKIVYIIILVSILILMTFNFLINKPW